MVHPIHVPDITTNEQDGTTSFIIEPLHRGFGVTLGNSLRRVLLSSLNGAAVTAFGIEGITHEFSTIAGVKEDVVQISLNIKRLRFRVYSDEPQTVRLSKKGKGAVTAADIETSTDVEVVNGQQHIATLDNDKTNFVLTLRIEKGRGYAPVEERNKQELPIDMVALDALFSPVERVRYKVEHTRVGQVTDLDRLVIDLSTDGTISPQDALRQSAAILVEQFAAIAGQSQSAFSEQTITSNEDPAELNFTIEDLALSPRTTNALLNNEITSVRDLLNLSDNELKNLKGFGSKAYQEVRDKLTELELR